jgi:membrane-associated protein
MELLHTIKEAIDPHTLIQFGYLGLFLIVFAESGLFFGFFLPGDSLLLVAGVAAAAGTFDIRYLVPLIFIAAFLGDQVGYWMGYRFGRALFNREESWLFRKEHVKQSEEFFAKHGNKTIILGRFVPIVRTFAPILAGIGNMPYKTFVTYNFIGAVLWGIGVTLIGYLLGNSVPNIEKYLHYIVGVIILASFVPVIMHLRGEKKHKPSLKN